VQWNTGTGCPEKQWRPHPWKHSRPGWTALWVTWSSWRYPCLLQEGWARWPLKIPSNPKHSMILFTWKILGISCQGFFLYPLFYNQTISDRIRLKLAVTFSCSTFSSSTSCLFSQKFSSDMNSTWTLFPKMLWESELLQGFSCKSV